MARELRDRLVAEGIRTERYGSEESLGKRIRHGETMKIPYLLVMGEKEIADHTVTVRNVKTKKQVTVSIDEFVTKTIADIAERKLDASIG
jgi:threonyl-tRNA synthetase